MQGLDIAIKTLQRLGTSHRTEEDVVREAMIMSRCHDHPNVALVYGELDGHKVSHGVTDW